MLFLRAERGSAKSSRERGQGRTSKVQSDTKGSAKLVVPRVSLPDRSVRIIHSARQTKSPQFLRYIPAIVSAQFTTVKVGTREAEGKDVQTSRMRSLKSLFALRGTMSTLTGAIEGGRESTPRATSDSRAQYECSSRE